MHSQLRNEQIEIASYIGIWCNGNTTDSGPVIPGSNPGIPTKRSIFQDRKMLFYSEKEIYIGIWCNGNTTDSGPVIPGSNPGIPTIQGHFSHSSEVLFLCAFLYERKSKSPMVLCIVGDLNKNPPCLGGVGGFPVCEDFYLFSASIALIFCLMSSSSSLSFCTLRFISSMRLLPFLLLALRKPRLFS